MPTTNERGIVSKSKLTALATAIKTKAGESGNFSLDDLVYVVADIGSVSGETITLSAVFDAGENKIFTTDTLDDIKQHLTVTATVNTTPYVLADDAYTLSGTLDAGSNTITVGWLNKTATFTVSGVIAATDVTPTLSGLSKANGVQYFVEGSHSVSLWVASAGTYKTVYKSISLDSGYRYRITADLDNHSGAEACIFVQNPSTYSAIMITNKSASDAHLMVDANPSESSSFAATANISFACVYSTSAIGCATYKNIKVIKYLEVS